MHKTYMNVTFVESNWKSEWNPNVTHTHRESNWNGRHSYIRSTRSICLPLKRQLNNPYVLWNGFYRFVFCMLNTKPISIDHFPPTSSQFSDMPHNDTMLTIERYTVCVIDSPALFIVMSCKVEVRQTQTSLLTSTYLNKYGMWFKSINIMQLNGMIYLYVIEFKCNEQNAQAV